MALTTDSTGRRLEAEAAEVYMSLKIQTIEALTAGHSNATSSGSVSTLGIDLMEEQF